MSENFIGCFDDVFSEKECQSMIDFFEHENRLGNSFKRMESPKSWKDDTAWNEYCKMMSMTDENNAFEFYAPEHPILLKVKLKIMNCFKEYADKWNSLYNGDPISISKGLKIQKTLPGEGYHIWHHENTGKDFSDRVAVYTVYLNDINDGGETEFLHQGVRVPPKRGTVCIFPASYTHVHRGNPPLKDAKYIVTGWFEYGWVNTQK